MTPLQEEWVKALESGNYKQITGFLKTESGYCCLGVLCEVAKIPVEVKDSFYIFESGQIGSIFENYEELGLYSGVGSFKSPINGYNNLTDMNDAGVSFKEIARIIRNNEDLIFTGEES